MVVASSVRNNRRNKGYAKAGKNTGNKGNPQQYKKSKVQDNFFELEAAVLQHMLNNKNVEYTLGELEFCLAIKKSEKQNLSRSLNFLRKDGKVIFGDGKYKIHPNALSNIKRANQKQNARGKGQKVDFSKFTDTVVQYDGKNFVYLPLHRDLRSAKVKITALKRDILKHNIQDGNIVRIHLKLNDDNGLEHGLIKEKVADKLKGCESEASIATYNIRTEFPQEVIDQVKNLKVFNSNCPKDMKGRVDLRHLPFVTIDGADARDFDDAVYVKKTKNGYIIIVAIADVGYYVKPETPIFEEALLRAFSVYFPDGVKPMNHERLSNDLCSLVPNEDRPVGVAEIEINNDGEILSYKHYLGVIHSHARLTYDEVQQAIEGDYTGKVDEEFYNNVIHPAYLAYQALENDSAKRGAMSLEKAETRIFIENGEITQMSCRERFDAHKLIEKFMILANMVIGHAQKDKLALYRVHEEPKAERVDDLLATLRGFGVEIPKSFMTESILHPSDFLKLNKEVEKSPVKSMLTDLIIRTMSKAIYTPDNIGHFGLAIGCDEEDEYDGYIHFTSPIRRATDLLTHLSLFYGFFQNCYQTVQKMGEHITEAEIKIDRAASEVVRRVLVGSYEERLGEEVEVVVTGIKNYGSNDSYSLNLTDPKTGADFTMRGGALKKLGYIFNEETRQLINNNADKIILGSKLKVTVKNADSLNMVLTADFVEAA